MTPFPRDLSRAALEQAVRPVGLRARSRLWVAMDERDPALRLQPQEQVEDDLARLGVEVPVGSSARIIAGGRYERSRDGHALLLSAGQLARPVAGPIGSPTSRERAAARSRASSADGAG